MSEAASNGSNDRVAEEPPDLEALETSSLPDLHSNRTMANHYHHLQFFGLDPEQDLDEQIRNME